MRKSFWNDFKNIRTILDFRRSGALAVATELNIPKTAVGQHRQELKKILEILHRDSPEIFEDLRRKAQAEIAEFKMINKQVRVIRPQGK